MIGEERIGIWPNLKLWLVLCAVKQCGIEFIAKNLAVHDVMPPLELHISWLGN